MEAEFWLKKWEAQEIGFHLASANPLLVRHCRALALDPGDRIFLPLCGKTLDIGWLLANGYRVAGAELSESAVKDLFHELGMSPTVSEAGALRRYTGDNLDIFVGDIFDLTGGVLGPVDAIYDRAALVALPEDMRQRYAGHLVQISNSAPQLLICFEYDQSAMAGPPFSIDADEVRRRYGGVYHLRLVETVDVEGGLKGVCAAKEHAWLLSPVDR
ncbi:MAG: thiopurine S-methyltransferase [Halioglobus sp.]|nr:thiopurine S-methyltransferase [Halioglobus sp.]